MAQSLIFNHYNFIQHIGCGFSADGQLFALKVFKAKQSMLYENEKRIMEELNQCPGVIQLASPANLNKQTNDDPNKFILMEYARQGNMLEFLQNSPLPESISRAYFTQLLQILENIHKRNIVHRDIKLENLLLDENYKLKVCDFGFAAKYQDQQGKKIKMIEHVGTLSTAAPEVYNIQPYSGVEADLFQVGVVLFQICSGLAPFKSANINEDQIYQLIYKNQFQKFWSFHEARLGQGFFSKDLKNLIQKLISFNPNQRLSIAEVYQHPWMQQNDITNEQIVFEMQRRKSTQIQKQMEIEHLSIL